MINDTLRKIIREAGAIMLGAEGKDWDAETKTSARDLVTIADIKSQNLIIKRLNQAFPGVAVCSEESPEAEQAKVYDPAFTGFIVDPIDGTFNFKRDMRESAVSIGYVEHGQPVTGVVLDPYKNELYAAIKGQGATRNGQPIHVSNQANLAGASVSTSNSYDNEAMARNLRRHLAIYEQTGIMPWTNCPGSGVLILTYVACGRFDIYHHNGLKPWDNPATFLLIREAGGKVLTLKGEEAPFTTNSVLAGPPELVGQLLGIFQKIDTSLLD